MCHVSFFPASSLRLLKRLAQNLKHQILNQQIIGISAWHTGPAQFCLLSTFVCNMVFRKRFVANFFCFQQCGEIEKLHMGVELLHKNHVLELLCVIEAVALSNNTFTRTLTLDTTLNYVNELMYTG